MKERFEYKFALNEYNKLKKYMNDLGYKIEATGSLRRKKNDIGDVDFLILGEDEEKILNDINKYKEINKRINKYEFMLKNKISIHAIPETKEMYNYTLWQSTGPKPHVRKIKTVYLERKMKLERINIKETKIYEDIDIEYLLPEERYKCIGE